MLSATMGMIFPDIGPVVRGVQCLIFFGSGERKCQSGLIKQTYLVDVIKRYRSQQQDGHITAGFRYSFCNIGSVFDQKPARSQTLQINKIGRLYIFLISIKPLAGSTEPPASIQQFI